MYLHVYQGICLQNSNHLHLNVILSLLKAHVPVSEARNTLTCRRMHLYIWPYGQVPHYCYTEWYSQFFVPVILGSILSNIYEGCGMGMRLKPFDVDSVIKTI